MSQNVFGRANQVSYNPAPKQESQNRQYVRETQYPVRTSNTTYEYRSNQTRDAPVRTSAYTTQGLNRQSAVYTAAVKNQTQSRANQNECGNYINTNINLSNLCQSQNRSSQIGRTYVYQPASRREYISNETSTRGHRGVSMETGIYQNTRGTYQISSSYPNQQNLVTGLNDRYRNNIYVSGSGSPGFRRYVRNMEDESTYKSYIRGGIVKLRKWKYTTQTEINKIILIQRYWRYVHLRRIERRQTLMSQSSEQKSQSEYENEIEANSSNSERYNENERYINSNTNYVNYGNNDLFKTETKVKKNAREKIISGTKNRYIVETTTIEVFKNQNTIIKKVAPEILEKETKKIKRIGIKEQMIEIWNTQNTPIYNDTLTILSEYDSNQYTQIIEEYEEQIKTMKSKIVQYEEEIIELTNRLKLYERKEWNKINQERKEVKINIRRPEKKFMEIVEILLRLRKPLQHKKENEIKILHKPKSQQKIIMQERDSIVIPGKPLQENYVEYIDELFFDELPQPDNDIQIVDQMEILKTEKEKPQWETIPSEECSLTILRQEKPENVVEERDSINIPAKDKPENQVEYIDELTLETDIRPENEMQIVDQMEILKEQKPENEIKNIDTIQLIYEVREWITIYEDGDKLIILGEEKPQPQNIAETTNEIELLGEEIPEKINVVEERDSIIISAEEKEPNQPEYIDELLLEELIKPENDIQIVDQMEILKEQKPENEIAYIEELNIPQLEKQPLFIETSDMLSIISDIALRKPKKEKNIIQGRDAIELLSLEKEPNNVEYIDELLIPGKEIPKNEI